MQQVAERQFFRTSGKIAKRAQRSFVIRTVLEMSQSFRSIHAVDLNLWSFEARLRYRCTHSPRGQLNPLYPSNLCPVVVGFAVRAIHIRIENWACTKPTWNRLDSRLMVLQNTDESDKGPFYYRSDDFFLKTLPILNFRGNDFSGNLFRAYVWDSPIRQNVFSVKRFFGEIVFRWNGIRTNGFRSNVLAPYI